MDPSKRGSEDLGVPNSAVAAKTLPLALLVKILEAEGILVNNIVYFLLIIEGED